MLNDLRGARVLVTGASGFLGSRLAERLFVECGAEVRVLVRRVMGAVRIARYPLEFIIGDITDPDVVQRAAADCRVIFNCTKGKGSDPALRRAVDVDSVHHLVLAASRTGTRVVHVSTMSVYDQPDEGDFDETTPSSPKGDYYADAKLEGERLVLALGAAHNVPVTVVQPTIVYGPHADIHGSEIIDELRTSRMILVNGGSGICNAVYIDDVVTALLLAATSDRAAGERFLVTGPEHPTWAEFIGSFEDMLGARRTVALSEAEALELWRRSRRKPWMLREALGAVRADRQLRARLLGTREGAVLRGIVKRWRGQKSAPRVRTTAATAVSEPVIQPIRPALIHNLARRARARSDKAESLLGHVPAFPLAAGMGLTRAWAQWAGLLEEDGSGLS